MNETLRLPARVSDAIERVRRSPRRARLASLVFAAACAVYAALALWLSRDAGFMHDQLAWFSEADGYSPGSLLTPHNDHIIAVLRVQFALSTDLFGAEHLPLRVAMIATVVAAASATWLLLRERLEPLVALPLAVLILFMGSVPELLNLSVVPFPQAVAAGLFGVLALERGRLGFDLLACGLLVLAVLSFEVGVAIAAGCLVWLALTPGRRRQAWVAMVPLVVFAAWWVWSRKFDQSIDSGTLFLLPSFALDSIAAALAALTALTFDFGEPQLGPVLDLDWGRPLAVLFLIAVAMRLRRVAPTTLLVGLVVALVALWAGGALSVNALRVPESTRYAYPIVILLSLLAAELARGWRPGRGALAAVWVIAGLALLGNLHLFRQQGPALRDASLRAAASLTTIELAAQTGRPPTFTGTLENPVNAADYLAAVERIGSPAMTVAELQRQTESIRRGADRFSVELNAIALRPAAGAKRGCRDADIGASGSIELSPEGVVLIAESGGTASLGRFADQPSVEVGPLAAGAPTAVEIPEDDEATPWRLAIASAGPVQVCRPG